MTTSGSTTRWWWVRHAPVVGVAGIIYGADDVACDTDDHPAFEALARRLPADAVWLTSHLSRTRRTFEAIRAAGSDAPDAVSERDLGEQSFGDWQGRSWSEMEEAAPDDFREFWKDPTRRRPPNGESFADQIARVGRVIDRYTEHHAGQDIVAVCHGGTIRAAISHALGLPPETGMSITVHTLSITRLEHIEGGLLRGRGGAWRVVGVNLPPTEAHE